MPKTVHGRDQIHWPNEDQAVGSARSPLQQRFELSSGAPRSVAAAFHTGAHFALSLARFEVSGARQAHGNWVGSDPGNHQFTQVDDARIGRVSRHFTRLSMVRLSARTPQLHQAQRFTPREVAQPAELRNNGSSSTPTAWSRSTRGGTCFLRKSASPARSLQSSLPERTHLSSPTSGNTATHHCE